MAPVTRRDSTPATPHNPQPSRRFAGATRPVFTRNLPNSGTAGGPTRCFERRNRGGGATFFAGGDFFMDEKQEAFVLAPFRFRGFRPYLLGLVGVARCVRDAAFARSISGRASQLQLRVSGRVSGCLDRRNVACRGNSDCLARSSATISSANHISRSRSAASRNCLTSLLSFR